MTVLGRSILTAFPALALLASAAAAQTPSSGPTLTGQVVTAERPAVRAPVLRGRVAAADGGSTAGMRVLVRAGAFADSAVVDSAGGFSLPLAEGLRGDPAEVVVRAAEGAEARYFPALARTTAAELARAEQRFVLVPRAWTIASGSFAGRTVEISVRRAFTAPCRDCSAFYRTSAPTLAASSAGGGPLLAGWPERSFPLRVAFDREYSTAPIRGRDSVAFWSAVEEMEADFGADLFRPAVYTETLPEGNGPDDVVLVYTDPTLRFAGLTTVLTEGPDIGYGAIRLQRPPFSFSNDRSSVMTHELVHALGFGHTCAWPSVLADLPRCPSMRTPGASPEDVAYAQLALRVRALQRSTGARWGMDAALAGEGEGLRASR